MKLQTKRTRRSTQFEALEPRILLAAWTTVDSVSPGNALEIAADASGDLYSAGATHPSNPSDKSSFIGTVRKSSDGGATWASVETFALVPGQDSVFQATAVDSTGNIVVSGWASDSSGIHHWVTAQSTDGGNSWTPVDDYLYPSSTATSIYTRGAAISGDNVYVVGIALQSVDQGTIAHWIVRQGSLSNPAGSWHTIDDYQLQSGQSAYASRVTIAPSGIFVTGTAFDGSSTNWLVRRSTDSGATWTTVDSVPQAIGFNLSYGITADPFGNLYTCGPLADQSGTNWTVRKSTNAGASWTTVDSYASPGGATPWDVCADGSGNVYIAGTLFDPSTNPQAPGHYIVRSSSNGGASWSTSDDYQPVAGTSYNMASGIVATFAGVFSTGVVANSDTAFKDFSERRWVVRRLTSPFSLTPFPATLTGFTTLPLTAVIGSFSSTNPNAKSSDFFATINWSDGQSSPGSITFNPATSRFDVSASHTYTTPGSYSVKITVTALGNLSTTINSTASITARGPQPHLTGPTLVYEGSSFSLQFSATDTDNLPITQWLIDWGDNSSDSLPGSATTASHSYPDGYALKHITATASDSAGYASSASLTLQIEDVPPTGDLIATAPATFGQPGSVTFSNVTDPSATDTAAGFLYSFDFNNDGVFDLINTPSASAAVPAHYLSTPGNHIVKARVSDKDGLFTDHTATLLVPSAGSTLAAGHDLLTPAAPIPAALYCASSGARDAGDGSMWISPGDFLAFCMDFGSSGIAKAKLNLRAGNANPTLKIQMRLDGASGPLLATFSSKALTRSGQSVRARKVTGEHELYIVVTNGQANITSFSFTPVQPKHARHPKSHR